MATTFTEPPNPGATTGLATTLSKVLLGNAASDRFTSTSGNDSFDGGLGTDTAVFTGLRSDHSVTKTAAGWSVSSPLDGIDSLVNIERLVFTDATVALDVSGNAGQAYRIYQAAFNRAPDAVGLGYWINALDGGSTLKSVAQGFVDSAEFKTLYGSNPTNTEIVTKLYENILHRTPDQTGYDFWLGVLNRNEATVAEVLASLGESTENVAQLTGVISNGVVYTPWGG